MHHVDSNETFEPDEQHTTCIAFHPADRSSGRQADRCFPCKWIRPTVSQDPIVLFLYMCLCHFIWHWSEVDHPWCHEEHPHEKSARPRSTETAASTISILCIKPLPKSVYASRSFREVKNTQILSCDLSLRFATTQVIVS